MRNNVLRPAIKLVLQILDQAYERRAWYGPNLKQSLRGVTAKQAAWRPAPGRHNISEVAVHTAYWKYVVRRRLRGEPRGSFSLPGSNWFARPGVLTEEAWRRDRVLLDQEHRMLRQAVSDLLRSPSREVPWSVIIGVAFHDVYHAGQIRLLRRLHAGAKRARARRG